MWNFLGLGKPKILPTYCNRCGCILEKEWTIISSSWDGVTGLGVAEEYEYLFCPEYKGIKWDSELHYSKTINKRKIDLPRRENCA